MSNTRTKATPEQVLAECGIRSRPVDLNKILRHFKIARLPLRASEDIFGAIVSQNGRAYIGVNPNQPPNRQRFTIAHELGHYFCHYSDTMERVDGDFRVHWRNNASSTGVNWEEIEANRFAAGLLMPENMVRKDVDHHSGSSNRDLVRELAPLYKVSSLAMQFRLINLGLLPPDVDPSDDP